MIAPWNVNVKHGHGEAQTDQTEAYGKHCSNSCSTGTLLHFVCGCTLVCASSDCKFKSVCVYVSCPSEFDPYSRLFRVNCGVKHQENIDCTWKLENCEVATEHPFPIPLQKGKRRNE